MFTRFVNYNNTFYNFDQKLVRFKWTPDCDEAFSKIKNALVLEPILSCPNIDYPFILQCDANHMG